MYSIREF